MVKRLQKLTLKNKKFLQSQKIDQNLMDITSVYYVLVVLRHVQVIGGMEINI